MVSIRIAHCDDVAQIEVCARAAYQKYVERIGRAPAPMIADFAALVSRQVLWVAVDERQVIGYAVFYPRDRFMHLENVAVSPHRQGEGIGRQLIALVEDDARERGLDGVELYTNERMTENQQLYPALGYTELGRAEEAGFQRVYYRKAFAGNGDGPDR